MDPEWEALFISNFPEFVDLVKSGQKTQEQHEMVAKFEQLKLEEQSQPHQKLPGSDVKDLNNQRLMTLAAATAMIKPVANDNYRRKYFELKYGKKSKSSETAGTEAAHDQRELERPDLTVGASATPGPTHDLPDLTVEEWSRRLTK